MNSLRDTNLAKTEVHDTDSGTLRYLKSMFSNADDEIIGSVYVSCDYDVNKTVDQLMVILGQTAEVDQKDLATIACSLLDPEKAPLTDSQTQSPNNDFSDLTGLGCKLDIVSTVSNKMQFQPIQTLKTNRDESRNGGNLDVIKTEQNVCVREKKPIKVKPVKTQPAPLKPIANLRKGPGKSRKHNKEANKLYKQSQPLNSTALITEHQCLPSDSTTSNSTFSSGSGSVHSVKSYPDDIQSWSSKPVDPFDPLGLNALWSNQGTALEDPKPQRNNRSKSGSTGLLRNEPLQGLQSNQRTPSLPPWAPAQNQRKHKAGFNKVSAVQNTVKAVDGSKSVNPINNHEPGQLQAAGVTNQKGDVALNKLLFRRVKSPCDIIHSYILEKQPVMVILRGLPGSGKSYLASQLISEGRKMGVMGVILSTDDFFMRNGCYVFNKNDLSEAHEWNKRQALQYVKESKSPIIIDNTNTTVWELLPYAVLAIEHRYDVQIFEPDTPWKFKVGELARRNTHSVTKDTLHKMKDRFQSLTLEQVLKEVRKSLSKKQLAQRLEGHKSNQPSLPALQEKTFNCDLLMRAEEAVISCPEKTELEIVGNENLAYQTLDVAEAGDNLLDLPQLLAHGAKTYNCDLLIKAEEAVTLSQSNQPIFPSHQDKIFNCDLLMKAEEAVTSCPKKTEYEILGTENSACDTLKMAEAGDSLLDLPELLAHDSKFLNSDLLMRAEEGVTSCPKKTEHKILENDNSSCHTLDVAEAVDNLLDLQEILAHDVTSSESFRSCFSELEGVSKCNSSGSEEQFKSSHPLFPLPEMNDPSLQGCSTFSKILAPSSESEELDPETPVAIEGNDRPPFLNIMQGMSPSNFPMGPRASSPVETKEIRMINAFVASDSKTSPSLQDQGREGSISSQTKSQGVLGETAQPLHKRCILRLSEIPYVRSASSLVAYSDTDSSSDPEAFLAPDLPGKDEQCVITKDTFIKDIPNLKDLTANDITDSAWKDKSHDFESSRDQSPETPQSRGATSSEKEGSPCPLTLLKVDVLPKRKRRVRVRKSKDQGPFLDMSLREKSKTESWSSFLTPPPGSELESNLPGDSTSESSTVETKSAVCQCEAYIFSMVHKLNSPSFKSLQPVDDAAICDDDGNGLKVFSVSFHPIKRIESDTNCDDQSEESKEQISFSAPRKSGTLDKSTSTDDSLNQEKINLEILQRCFPEYSIHQLEEVMAICHNDVEWVTSHLLDSPAVIDEDDGSDREGEKGEARGQDMVSENADSRKKLGFSCPKPLAQLSRSILKNSSQIDSDDLEMQVIHTGQSRLQTIEQHHWSRQHSSSSHRADNNLWASEIGLEKFSGTVEPGEFCQWNQSPRQAVKSSLSPLKHHSASSFPSVSPQANKGSYLSSLMSEKKFSGPLLWLSSEEDSSGRHSLTKGSTMPAAAKPQCSPLDKPVVSRELIGCLEKMFGSLGLAENQDLPLDHQTALKIYNCLRLQVAKTKIVTDPSSLHKQVQNDEALARALQEEENEISTPFGFSSASSQVAGWTSHRPSWMACPQNHQPQFNLTQAKSVSGTLQNLRQVPGMVRTFANHRQRYENRAMPPAAGSAWSPGGFRMERRPDSLHSIIAEEEAAESVRQEQLQSLEALGEDLSTKIKRSQLSQLFPTLPPDLLEEVFMQSNFSLEKTTNVLQTMYGLSPAPGAQEIEEAMVRKAEDNSRIQMHPPSVQHQDDLSYLCDPNLSYIGYDELRAEAQLYRRLANDCKENANKNNQDGWQGAAFFYRQEAKKYKEKEYEANHRAAAFLFDKGSERLSRENTLDLHFYHIDEAIIAVNKAVEMKEQALRLNPCKKNSYLNVVTGQGRNSKGGVPRLKPAIINHLMDRALPFEEKTPGMLRVHIGQRL